VNETAASKASDIFWGMVADAFKYSNDSTSIPPDRSLKDFFVAELEDKDLSADEKKLVLKTAEMWGAFIGDPLEKQSLKYFWLEECIDGGFTYIPNIIISSTKQSPIREPFCLLHIRRHTRPRFPHRP
jgi:hypothetical protein